MMSPFRDIAVACVVALCAMPLAARADSAPCSAQMKSALKIAGTAPDDCQTTATLVPGRPVVLAVWMTDPDSPTTIPFVAVLDRKALEAGKKVFLYKRQANAEAIQPFQFDGKTVDAAIADFDGTGRTGFAIWVVPDTDYFFAITVYDPKSGKFIEPDPSDARNEMTFTATDVDAMVRLAKGQVMVPICEPPTLYYDVYTLKNGAAIKGKRIPAAAATAAERAKCKAMAQ